LLAGLGAFAVTLAAFPVVDGDLWARLAVGALCLRDGAPPRHDLFAFTPVQPLWVDHEWGSGVVFYALLKCFGPRSLMVVKIVAGVAALSLCLVAARKNKAGWTAIGLLAVPCAGAMLPGFMPVVRSQVFTFVCFAATLLGLLRFDAGRRWPVLVVPLIMALWVNLHGGFVTGLILIAVFASAAITRPDQRLAFMAMGAAALAVTLLNPYGLAFWSYLIPAWLHPRAAIGEWGRMPIWRGGAYAGFPILFALAAAVLILGRPRQRSWVGLVLLALTAYAGWRHRRHAPFLGMTALVFMGPYVEATLERGRVSLPAWTLCGIYLVGAALLTVGLAPRLALTPTPRF
jgi:hypothetical protein